MPDFSHVELQRARDLAHYIRALGGIERVKIELGLSTLSLADKAAADRLQELAEVDPGAFGKLILALSAAGQVPGVTDNTPAAAGTVGEVFSSAVTQGSAVGLTTNTAKNVTSIQLPAGDWDVSGQVSFSLNAATTLTRVSAWMGLTSDTFAPITGGLSAIRAALETGVAQFLNCGTVQLPVSGPTTVYLGAEASFGVNTCSAYGKIWARRAR